MTDDDDVTTVQLGGKGRRWLPVAAALVGAWVVVVLVMDGNGDGASPPPSPASTTVSTDGLAPSSTERPDESTTTTTAIPGAPLLGRATGWHLVVTNSSGIGKVVDLDTGGTERFDHAAILGARLDGVLAQTQAGAVWFPYPFDDDTSVLLAEPGFEAVYLTSDDGVAWVVERRRAAAQDQPLRAHLVSLADGSTVTTREFPAFASPIGTIGGSFVFAAGGDAFVAGTDGGTRRIDGRPVAVLGNRVVVQRCPGSLRCGYVAVDPTTGDARDLPWPADLEILPSPANVTGSERLVVGMPDGTTLVLAEEAVTELPDAVSGLLAYGSSWTPDGSLLLVPGDREVQVVDPDADGGAAVVSAFPLSSASNGVLAVVGAAG